jgi:hypothetical protein
MSSLKHKHAIHHRQRARVSVHSTQQTSGEETGGVEAGQTGTDFTHGARMLGSADA